MGALGLIPAHAGKTGEREADLRGDRAHPRSRGENQDENIVNLSKQGSSPLTRGKPASQSTTSQRQGLIPAHAGKTEGYSSSRARPRAHPRSRGENWNAVALTACILGSSPLTRGKRYQPEQVAEFKGLIPAHAGKTTQTDPQPTNKTAHPRSRGENRCVCRRTAAHRGSSPLTRGKLRR